MPHAVACFKWVLDSQDIVIRPDLTIDTSRAAGKISEYDRNLLQAAKEAAQALGGKALGLTFGDESVRPALKDALSRGLDEVVFLSHPAQKTADGGATAAVLAAAARTLEDVAVIFCAEGAGDTFARQVGPRLAARLDLPAVTSVCRFTIEDGRVMAVRKLEDTYETVCVPCPVVLSILPDAAEAPIPGLRAVMAAGKKPQTQLELSGLGLSEADLEPKARIVGEQGYRMQRKRIRFAEGDDYEKAEAFVSALVREGVL